MNNITRLASEGVEAGHTLAQKKPRKCTMTAR